MSTIPIVDARTFGQYRHYYLRVSTQGQNRLTISTFLAGLTFAAFAALLTMSPISTPPLSNFSSLTFQLALANTVGSGDWWATLCLAGAIILLGIATYMFLLVVVSTYRALQHFADLSPSTLTLLDTPLHPASDGTYPAIPTDDVMRLKDAFDTYMMSAYLIPRGIGMLFLSLPLIAFHSNWFVGLGTLISAMLVVRRRSELQGVAMSTLSRRADE